VEVQPLEGVVHVSVLVHPPVRAFQVIVHECQAVQEQLLRLPDLGAPLAVEDVGLGHADIAVLDERGLHQILDLLHRRNPALAEEIPLQSGNDILGHPLRHPSAIVLIHRQGSLKDGVGDFLAVEGHDSTISFADLSCGNAHFFLLDLELSATPPASELSPWIPFEE